MPEIPFAKIESALSGPKAGPPDSVHLVFGEDYLVEEAANAVLDRIFPDTADRQAHIETVDMSDGESIYDIVERITTLSFFSATKVLRLKADAVFKSGFSPDEHLQKIEEARLSDDIRLAANLLKDILSRQGAVADDVITGDPAKVIGADPNAYTSKDWIRQIAAHLAETGVPVLSQCHDFAEDQRPENWRHLAKALGDGQHLAPDAPLYPHGPHAGLAVLNARDRDILVQAGAPAESVRLLPNPVTAALSPEAATPARYDAPPLVLYPTRAIRRKNLGELLLWAAAMGTDARFATTLEPTHPHDLAVYQNWMALAERLRLPVRFGVGVSGETAYHQHLRAAAALITTSVAEGFGLAFLEPWLMGKPLTGRRLPEITADMEAEDIALRGLYDQLWVPLDWIDRGALRTALDQGLETAYATYRMPRPDDAVDAALSALSTTEQVDFGGLDETLQQQVIDHVAGSPEGAAALRPARLTPCAPDDPLIRRNRERIQARYAPAAYGERLHRLYLRLLEANGPIDFTPPEAVLRQFLNPERFRLLRQGTGA